MKLTHIKPGYVVCDGWLSSGGYTVSVCNQQTRSTQPCIPPGSLNRVSASAGVRAEIWPLPLPYDIWVPVAVRRVANCYTPFALPYLKILRFQRSRVSVSVFHAGLIYAPRVALIHGTTHSRTNFLRRQVNLWTGGVGLNILVRFSDVPLS